MTLKIGRYEIVIFKVTKLETYPVEIDQAQRQANADAIRNSETFKAIVERAKALRAMRDNGDEFANKYIENIARC